LVFVRLRGSNLFGIKNGNVGRIALGPARPPGLLEKLPGRRKVTVVCMFYYFEIKEDGILGPELVGGGDW